MFTLYDGIAMIDNPLRNLPTCAWSPAAGLVVDFVKARD